MAVLFSVSLGAFLSMFPAILHIIGVDVPDKRNILIDKTVEVLGINKELFNKILDIKFGRYKFSKNEGREIWEKYIEQVRKIAFEIDKLQV